MGAKNSNFSRWRALFRALTRGLKREALLAALILRDTVELRKSVYLEKVDRKHGLVQLSSFSRAAKLSEDLDSHIIYPSRSPARGRWINRGFRHYFWVRLNSHQELVLDLPGKPMRLRCRGVSQLSSHAQNVFGLAQLQYLLRPGIKNQSLPANIAALRAHAFDPEVALRFRNAWLLMDRVDHADDNAEHLSRHLLKTDLAERTFFVLDRRSPDWKRLEEEGFNLLAFRSPDHIAAVIHADIIASSQATGVVRWPIAKVYLEDLVHYKFGFLQHGVIMNDLSQWLNNLPIDLLVTTTEAEFNAIVSPESPYIFSQKEVVLTGLARHDSLLKHIVKKRFLTISPTWRKGLTGLLDADFMARRYKSGFASSAYAKAWQNLLNCPDLRQIADAHGLTLLFIPHPNMRQYIAELQLRAHVQIYSAAAHGSYQSVLHQTGLCITDYSSLAMDMGFCNIPIVYYQFDEAEIFSQHTFKRGYYDYRSHGFGPVTIDQHTTLIRVSEALGQQELPVYSERRLSAFPMKNGQCCAMLTQKLRDLL